MTSQSDNEKNLWKRFSKIVDLYPSNSAFEDEVNSYSYSQLRSMIQSFAAEVKLGEGQNPFVVSFLSPGIQYIVSSLATLYVSKIVVVIHDNYTATQVEACLATLHYPTVVTTEVKWMTLGVNYPHVHFVPEKVEVCDFMARDLPIESKNESLKDPMLLGVAYCFSTSGSTGTPKSVLMTHRCIANAIDAVVSTDRKTFTPNVRGLMGVALSFTPSLSDIWTIFSNGGTLVVPPTEIKLDIDRYRKWITEKRITAATFATPMMEAILAKDVDKLTSLRWVTFGGARINPNRICMKDAKFNVFHVYGISESFTTSKCFIPAGTEKVTTSVGRPISGMKVYVVNEEGQEITEPGVGGDLYVAGEGIMRGYYGQPSLTAKVLVPNRFDPELSPMFVTGDVGYWSTEGDLYVTGRKDEQVKIHGMRLELGEIGTALCTFPGIRQAVAVTREQNGNVQIFAFCTLDQGHKTPGSKTLNEFLLQRLQRHAIPRSISFLPELPKTSSGKVNRMELKNQVNSFTSINENLANHDSANEEVSCDWLNTVRSVWANVLKIDPEEIRSIDNFFYLGGNSILVFGVLEQLRMSNADLNDISPFLLFNVPVLCDFAQALKSGEKQMNKLNFFEEIQLPRDFQLSINSDSRNSKNVGIFITGTTGFLGRLLLFDALKTLSDNTEIFTIVRAGSDAEARHRLTSLPIFSNDLKKFERVSCFAGDLTQVNFELKNHVWEKLVKNVGVIFHCAAEVSFMKTYDQLKSTTVAMTNNVLRFAMEGSPKEFHFMSSVGVFDGIENSNSSSIYEVSEDRIPLEVNPSKMANGYTQSKWVSEQLVWACAERGLVASIYRIGQIGAHSETKSVNQSDAIAGFIVTCQKLGKFPRGTMRLPFIDGDVSKVILQLSQIPPVHNSNSSTRVFHLVGKEVGIEDFFEGMSSISLEEWEIEFEKSIFPAPKTQDQINAWIFLQMFKQAQEQMKNGEKSLMKNVSFSVNQTVAAVGNSWRNVNTRGYADLLGSKL